MDRLKIEQGALSLLHQCALLQNDEKCLVIVDEDTLNIGELLKSIGEKNGLSLNILLSPKLKIHGEEPSPHIAEQMIHHDVVIGLTKMSLAHTNSVVSFCKKGGKYLSLPDYSMQVLSSPALHYNFSLLQNISSKLSTLMTKGNQITIQTSKGTNLTCDISTRKANKAPGFCYEKGTIASPPDAEVNIAPLENLTNGIIVVDGSIPCNEIGLLKKESILTIKEGKVVKIEGEKASTLEEIFSKYPDNAKIIAEIGIGLNPLAKLSGSMLEDEGCLGTMHVGIGSNILLGGTNRVPFHLDFIFNNPNMQIDNVEIINNGKILGF